VPWVTVPAAFTAGASSTVVLVGLVLVEELDELVPEPELQAATVSITARAAAQECITASFTLNVRRR
jgi:hypothetical protein